MTPELREKMDQENGKKFIGECMFEGAKIASAAFSTLSNMNEKV